jgi:hypothetical protein
MRNKKEAKAKEIIEAGANPGPGFYGDGLETAGREALEKARAVEGLDDEIALIRLKLKELTASDPGRLDLFLKSADTIARLVSARHRMTGRQKQSLREAITKVLTEIAIPIGGAATKAILRK